MAQQLQGDTSQPSSTEISDLAPDLEQADVQPTPELQEPAETPVAHASLPIDCCNPIGIGHG